MFPLPNFSRKFFYCAIASVITIGFTTSAYSVSGVPPYPSVLPLNSLNGSTTGFRMDGPLANGWAGEAVAGIGDINGDGVDDIAVGAPGFNGYGRCYIVFGRNKSAPFQSIFNLGSTDGFVITDNALSRPGNSVGSAGDINGDGIDDLVIGAPSDGNGKAYVIFGRDTKQPGVAFPSTLNLATDLMNGEGFRIEGGFSNAELGSSVGTAGDINGDGIDDLLIGARFSENAKGRVYVIFGHHTSTPPTIPFPAVANVSLMDGTSVVKQVPNSQSGFNGFQIVDSSGGDFFGLGNSVSRAGNINSDVFGDFIIGAPGANLGGSAYVLFGHGIPFGDNNGILDLVSIDGTNGFRLDGVEYDRAGSSVSGGGDVNDDGISDVIIGADHASEDGLAYHGRVYLISGKPQSQAFTSPINLGNLSVGEGVKINGAITSNDHAGVSASLLKDFNGDGVDDILIGAPFASPENLQDGGSAFVVFGKRQGHSFSASVDLASLTGADGFRMDGATAFETTGWSVHAAGDVNNDGLNDLIIGAHLAETGSPALQNAGRSYVVFGNDAIFVDSFDQ